MANGIGGFAALLRRGTKGVQADKKERELHEKEAGDLKPNAAFKRKFGILKKSGKAKPAAERTDSDYGFPLPSKGHPKAVRYAHAVLSRAHQAKDFDAADVAKQVRKANVILYGKANPTPKDRANHAKTKESGRTRLREYLPITPEGSWERISADILQAAQVNPAFDGSVEGHDRWNISIWASYPSKSAVIIANTAVGKLWLAKYAIDDYGGITFPIIKDAKSSVKVQEALRANAKRGNVVPMRARESGSGVGATKTKLTESLTLHARVREVQVDEDGKGARAVCVMLSEGAGNPADRHWYTKQCIEAAAADGTFEGVQSFADHSDEFEERNRPERSIRDLIGWWSDTHVEEADGRAYLIGTFNIETGNDFALNKMREAKRFSEKFPDGKKQYVGFSIYAGGMSEAREIDGTTYNAVLQITEAGSTDMVTRAGAGGRMLSLKEVQQMGNVSSLGNKREQKKIAESIATKLLEALGKKGGVGRASVLTEAQLSAAFDAAVKDAGLESTMREVGDKHIDGLKKAFAKHVSNKLMGKGDEDEEEPGGSGDEEEALTDIPGFNETGATGDGDIDELLGDEDSDEDDDDEDPDEDEEDDGDAMESGRKKRESATLTARERKLIRENEALRLKDRVREVDATARRLIREANVPKAIAKDVYTFLTEQCKSEKAMRAYLGTIKPTFTESVNGNPARRPLREGTTGGSLLSISGVE